MFWEASPDRLVTSDCHQQAVLEIKCPAMYRKSLKNWSTDKDFPIDPNEEIRRNQQYYFQIQYQMLTTGVSHDYFYPWTPSTKANNFLFVDVAEDPKLCGKMLEKFNTLFIIYILPEPLTYRNDPSNESNDQNNCFCRRPLSSNDLLHFTV